MDIISHYFPIVAWLPKYKFSKYILHDLSAGLTLATLSIPQAMAYAILASLPPVYGLYNAIFPALFYIFFGTSPIQSIGPFAVVALLLGDSCVRSSAWISDLTQSAVSTTQSAELPWEQYPFIVDVSLYTSFNVGLVLLFIYLTNAGKLLSYVLQPTLIEGFISGAAIAILTAQFKSIFGVRMPSFNGVFSTVNTWISLLSNFGTVNGVTFLVGLLSFLTVIGLGFLETSIRKQLSTPSSFSLRRWINESFFRRQQLLSENDGARNSITSGSSPPAVADATKQPNSFPAVLFVVIIATFLSWGLQLNRKSKVSIVGSVPSGLPPFSLPFDIFNVVPKSQVSAFVAMQLKDAIFIALVTYVTSVSLTRAFPMPLLIESDEEVVMEDGDGLPTTDTVTNPVPVEQRSVYKPINDDRQELLAVSISTILGTFVSCYVPSGSLSKSAVLATQTQVRSLFGNALNACAALISILFLTPFFYHMPMSTLAAVIIIALMGTLKKIGMGWVYFMKALSETRELYRVNLERAHQTPSIVVVDGGNQTSDHPSPTDGEVEQLEQLNHNNKSTASLNSASPEQGSSMPQQETTHSHTTSPNNQSWLHILRSYLSIWRPFLLWISTFILVVIIDSSTGILVGMVIAACFLLFDFASDYIEKKRLSS